jgi:hypothetical protein
MEIEPMKFALLALPLALGITACSGKNESEEGTTINIDATTDKGSSVQITADGKTGNVGFKVPGFDTNIRLPKKLLDDSNFDIDGVKLYPGSTVDTVNITANEKGGKDEQTYVRIGFTSPADPAKVSDWFKDQFGKQSIKADGDAAKLTGTTKDGEDFTIELTEKDGKTAGLVNIRK